MKKLLFAIILLISFLSFGQTQDVNGISLNGPKDFVKIGDLHWNKGNENVIINVASNYVEYALKSDLLIPLLYKGEIENQMTRHYSTTKDIERAFQRLISEQEAPAIIIAELLEESTNKVEKT